MAKRFTVAELEAVGMDKNQIAAILATYDVEDEKETAKKAKYQELTKTAEEEKAKVIGMSDVKRIPAKFGVDKPVNYDAPMTITTIEDLQQYAGGTLVRFPDFAEGQPFVARVRRPSLLVLAKTGQIPNSLLASANELFSKGGSGLDSDNVSMMADLYDICEVIAEAALKEPTYQQIKDAGIELSDNQLMAIFNYTQTGIKALESFR